MASPVDDFLGKLAEPQRAALEDLRRVIRKAAPGAAELINYGVPMFRLNGKNLVSFAAAKDHCSFYVQSPAVMNAHAAELTGFKTSKGTAQFTPDKPIPSDLVKKLVMARIAENEATAKRQKPSG
ncbi:MAG: DUF1801 domain-containing protein [Chloroflexota bacterium]